MKNRLLRLTGLALMAGLLLSPALTAGAADERPVGERLSEAADSAKASIQEAGTAAADKVGQVWRKIDEQRLKNRSRDEIVAWVLMGLLAGALAGLLTVLRTTAAQRLTAVALGLVGAFVGGMVSRLAELDFGMGPILIRYEDLVLSLAGGLILVFLVRLIMARRRKQV